MRPCHCCRCGRRRTRRRAKRVPRRTLAAGHEGHDLVGRAEVFVFADLHTIALAEARVSGAKRIAGSIGPLVASYRPDLHPSAAEGAPIYAEIAQMIGPSCDLMICETKRSIGWHRHFDQPRDKGLKLPPCLIRPHFIRLT